MPNNKVAKKLKTAVTEGFSPLVRGIFWAIVHTGKFHSEEAKAIILDGFDRALESLPPKGSRPISSGK